MKIKSIKIKNFKCLGPDAVSLDFTEDILVLIGENNVGKSSVLESLKVFLSGQKTISKELFFKGLCDKENAIEITLSFNQLSESDKQHQAVSPYVIDVDGEETWTLRKRYFYNDDGKSEHTYSALKPDGTWKDNPAGLNQNPDDLFTEEKMNIAFIPAVKNVSEESSANTKSAFGQIFNMIVKGEVEKSDEYIELEKSIERFSKLFEGSKKLSSISNLEGELNNKIQRVMAAVSRINLEIPSLKGKVMPTPILLTNDNRDIDVNPENQGNGFQRTLIFCLLEMLAEQKSPPSKNIGPRNLIIIEEPEIYMHPQMERKLADTLYNIAKLGNSQVICTTHSPIFINISEKHKSLVRLLRKEDNLLQVFQKDQLFSGVDAESNRNKLRMITNFDPTVNEIFFAKRVVLVEGDTEIAVFKESVELLNYFDSEQNKHKKRDTTFVNCRGKWTINLFQEVMNNFEINYVVIHDKDDEELSDGANGRILSLLNNDESRRKLFDHKIESILGIKDTGNSKPIKALIAVHELKKNNQLESKLGSYVKFAYGI